jgi:hypothetical protein
MITIGIASAGLDEIIPASSMRVYPNSWPVEHQLKPSPQLALVGINAKI